MDLNSIVTDILKEQAVNAIAEKTGLDSNISKLMIAKALPILLSALKDNSVNSEKKESLEKAVKNNNWTILDNLTDISLLDWRKILGHIFWDKKEEVEKEVWNNDILASLAPIVMWALWKANSESWETASSLLSSDSMISNITKWFIDKDGDWEIKDDLLWMAMWFLGKK